MTILLVFLIKSFSVEGNIITPVTDLQLPNSSSKISTQQMNSLKITKKAILANDQFITELNSFKNSDSLIISPLNIWLKAHPSAISGKNGELMIQSDKEISFDVIKKVMFTCSQAGIADFTILVMREE
jgi:biopolymer transport protein ExbD